MSNAAEPLTGKTYFVTGGTAGLGRETILALSRRSPAHIYFTGRNEAAGRALIDEVRAASPGVGMTFFKADISSLASVKGLADEFLATKPDRLDVLMCNAGIMATGPALSADGYELQFATNHLGHALLINHLLPLLARTSAAHNDDARIICLSSSAHNMHPKAGIDLATLRTTQQGLGTLAGASWARYGQSKLANMLYADELARRHPALTCVSVHPGMVQTGLGAGGSVGKRLGMWVGGFGATRSSPSEGARNQTWAATAEIGEVRSGVYYVPVGVEGRREGKGNDVALAKSLWEWTQKELAAFEGV